MPAAAPCHRGVRPHLPNQEAHLGSLPQVKALVFGGYGEASAGTRALIKDYERQRKHELELATLSGALQQLRVLEGIINVPNKGRYEHLYLQLSLVS